MFVVVTKLENDMAVRVEELLRLALDLPEQEKLALVDGLMQQLHGVDSTWESAWVSEVQERSAAYHEGRLSARPAKDVINELRQK
jgi:hypothetical protein